MGLFDFFKRSTKNGKKARRNARDDSPYYGAAGSSVIYADDPDRDDDKGSDSRDDDGDSDWGSGD